MSSNALRVITLIVESIRFLFQGKEYVTGSLETSEEPTKGDKSGYFMIHVNNYSTVQTVTCVNKRGEGHNGSKRSALRSGNILCLYGKNEKLLNRMVSRLESVIIAYFFGFNCLK